MQYTTVAGIPGAVVGLAAPPSPAPGAL